MRARLALVLALTFTFSLLPEVAAESTVSTSTTGVRIMTLPGGPNTPATAISDSNWVAAGPFVWRGVGYPDSMWNEVWDAGYTNTPFLTVVDANETGDLVGTWGQAAQSKRSFFYSASEGLVDLGGFAVDGIVGDQMHGVWTSTGGVAISRYGTLAEAQTTGWNFIENPADTSWGFGLLDMHGDLAVGSSRTWRAGAGYEPLDGAGFAVNSSGVIAGYTIIEAGVDAPAARWTSRDADPEILGTLGSDPIAVAYDINDNGWIVGSSSPAVAATDGRRAFLWRPGLGMQDLGRLAGDTDAVAHGINNNGLIVGQSGGRAVIWDVSNSFTIDYPPEVDAFGTLNTRIGPAWQTYDLTVGAGSTLSQPIDISDPEGDTFTVEWTGLPAGAVWDGSTLSWTPDASDEGTHEASLLVTQDSNPGNTVQIDVVIDVTPPTPTLDPIGDKQITPPGDVTFTATAAPGTPGNDLFFRLASGAPSGASITSGGLFTWSVDPYDTGDHEVTVIVDEQLCTIFDPVCPVPTVSDQETITISVIGPPGGYPPDAKVVNRTAFEGQLLNVSRAWLVSDYDTDITDITLTIVETHGPIPDGLTLDDDLEWTPTEAQGPGTYQFTLRAEDESANVDTSLVTISVPESNEPPAVDPPFYPEQTVEVGDTLNLLIAATDPDLPAQDIFFAMHSGPGNVHPTTGAYAFAPGPVDLGLHFAEIEVYDELGATTYVLIPINVVGDAGNLPPVATDDDYSTSVDTRLNVEAPGVLGNDLDPDGDPFEAILFDGPNHQDDFELLPSGGFTYLPTSGFVGTDSFAYFADDGQRSNLVTVTIDVEPAPPNRDPIIDPIVDQFVFEGFQLVIDPVVTDPDEDAPLGHEWLGDRPSNAIINGIFDFTPDETQGGKVYTVEYVATDGRGGEARDAFTITVIETNQAPVLDFIFDEQGFVGDTITFDADATDADVPAQSLTFSLEDAPAGASIDPTTGAFQWPNATKGYFEFDVIVEDDWIGPSGPAAAEDRQTVALLILDPTELPNDVALDLTIEGGDPDGDAIVDLGGEVTLRAAISESNLGVSGVVATVRIPGAASLVSSTGDVCEAFSINGAAVLACDVGSVFGARDLDIVVTFEETKQYDIVGEVESNATPDTDLTNNSAALTLEAHIQVSLQEVIGVTDADSVVPPLTLDTILEAIGVTDSNGLTPPLKLDAILERIGVHDLSSVLPPLDLGTILEAIGVTASDGVVPPLDLATILEAIAVGDGSTVMPPLTLDTILEAIGVTDLNGVVPPLNLATIVENIAVADSGNLIYDSDGNGNVDITVVGVDPDTGEAIVETTPGTQVLVASGGMVPGTTATVVLFSDPVHLADVTVDDEGNFAVVVTIPLDTAPGDHRIVVTGDWAKGEGQLDAIFPIHVLGVCTIVGTTGNDFLFGTRGDDIICGFAGDDVIFGGGGNDRMFGGPGADVLLGGRGHDELFGDEGDDVIYGGRGRDHLDGGPGVDLLVGGRGSDTIIQ